MWLLLEAVTETRAAQLKTKLVCFRDKVLHWEQLRFPLKGDGCSQVTQLERERERERGREREGIQWLINPRDERPINMNCNLGVSSKSVSGQGETLVNEKDLTFAYRV